MSLLARCAHLTRTQAAAICACLLLLPLAAHARGGNTIYRCIDPFGQVTIQNGGCPKGTKQDKVVSAPAPSVSVPPPVFQPLKPPAPLADS